MSHAFQIDTLAFAKKLQAAGADEQLAEVLVEGITGADTSRLATKEDLAHVEVALKEDIGLVKEDISGLRVDMGNMGNAIVYKLGGFLGFLFVVDRLLASLDGRVRPVL